MSSKRKAPAATPAMGVDEGDSHNAKKRKFPVCIKSAAIALGCGGRYWWCMWVVEGQMVKEVQSARHYILQVARFQRAP